MFGMKKKPPVREVDAETVQKERDQLLLIDIRGGDEYRGPLGHVPGARHIPLAELESAASELPSDARVVTVCHSGRRSITAAETLTAKGFTNVASMKGGMLGWNERGYEVER